MKKNDILGKVAVRQFLALLRAGLWGASCETEYFENDDKPDWKGILYLAKTQAVLPLVYDGMLTLPEHMRLNGPALLKLIAYVDRIEGLNQALDEAAAEISSRLETEGIRSVLLKGQGLATLYRIPGHRQCGDIDLYVGEKNYRKAADIIRTWKDVEAGSAEKEKHIGFRFHGMELELHRHALSMPGIKMAKKSNAWEYNELMNNGLHIRLGMPISKVGPVINTQIEKALAKEEICTDTRTAIIPMPQFNIFYTFCHAFTHFMISGLGLRQLCDIAMLLHQYHSEITPAELESWLKEYKLDKEWKLFIHLIVNHIGLPPEEAVLYDNTYIQLTDKLLDTIIDDGNFGQHKSLPDYSHLPIVLKKAGSLLNHHIVLWKRLRFSRRQTFMHYFHLWYIGLFDFVHEI